MPDDATEGVAKHSSRLQPSIILHDPVTAFRPKKILCFQLHGSKKLGKGGIKLFLYFILFWHRKIIMNILAYVDIQNT